MDPADVTNAVFEVGGSLAVLWSIRRVLRDKKVAGISWGMMVFFTMWGLWNLVYYPSLGQWYSFAAGATLVVMNAIYVALLIKYSRKSRGTA